jgi:hypothetical protein
MIEKLKYCFEYWCLCFACAAQQLPASGLCLNVVAGMLGCLHLMLWAVFQICFHQLASIGGFVGLNITA